MEIVVAGSLHGLYEGFRIARPSSGDIEGVKYERVGVVLTNAVKEQQTQIESIEKRMNEQKQSNENLQKQIDAQMKIIVEQQLNLERQRAEIEALKQLICSQNPKAEVCNPKNLGGKRNEKDNIFCNGTCHLFGFIEPNGSGADN